MSDTYTVQRGDNLTKIARRHGYPSWRVVYNHPDNAAFRRKRPNPNLIHPGDVIVLPAQPGTSLPPATLSLPRNFASRLRLSPRLMLQPVRLPISGPLPSQVPAGLRPPFPRSSSASRPTPVVFGGPVTGGYGEALKWTGRAILRYPYVQRQLDNAKDWGLDLVWRTRSPLGKGLSIGIGLTGVSLLLSFEPTREFIHDSDIGLGLIGLEGVSLRPLLGIDGNWGGVVKFDLMKLGD